MGHPSSEPHLQPNLAYVLVDPECQPPDDQQSVEGLAVQFPFHNFFALNGAQLGKILDAMYEAQTNSKQSEKQNSKNLKDLADASQWQNSKRFCT